MPRTLMLSLFFLLFQIAGLVTSIHAVLNTRTAQGAIAWVVSLNTLPVVSVPAYWVFGRSKFVGYVNTMKDSSLSMAVDREKAHASLSPYLIDQPENFAEYPAIRTLSNTPFMRGNRVELLIDGQNTYDGIEAGIKRARNYILFQFYILRADDSGNRFKKLLIEKARQGVAVHVLYDELGSGRFSHAWLSDFREAGVKIIPFNTTQGAWNRFQINFRNHRKIVVVDGRETWIGGLNIGDEYLGRDPKLSPWRDTHLHIQGPVSLVAQSIFWSDWYWADKKLLRHLNWEPEMAPGLQPGEGMDALILGSGPADDLETASLFFTTALNAAKKRIWIATPYFIPDEATTVALKLALLRGVDVRIITPRINDNWFVRHAANVYLSNLADMGARVYYYEKGFMHQKTILLDDGIALIGTVNFDNRSFRLNFEVTGAIADTGFASKVEQMLLHDLQNSTELKDYDLARQGFWERLKARGSALLSPVL
ncbi:cardiolipin synthase [Thiolapillus brandeum]|uniref:Cardiolipin synthase n=2 Tax=Thiolapillus brandeum TaxID=1076588 RepID=A0A7U6JIB2_9GAMM|nr:cardiolipin synthase [Thiolapillus brandeum]